jgi:hypothetical protein
VVASSSRLAIGRDPPSFTDGGEARSKRFDPNNLKQIERWQKEVASVFGVEQEGKKARRDSRIPRFNSR